MPNFAELLNVKTVGLMVFILIAFLGLKWCGGRNNNAHKSNKSSKNDSTSTAVEKEE